MDQSMNKEGGEGRGGVFRTIMNKLYILEVPNYGNRIFYSLGFLALTCLVMLVISGVIAAFFGTTWWLTDPVGIFMRSVHLWAGQAFILIIFLHILVVFATSGFKAPRRLTWVLGSLMLLLALTEAEFGYGLRGDYSSQFRELQAADFFNGAYLGNFINTLNHLQIYGIHVILIPLILAVILMFHYLLVKTLGIAKPYRPDVPYKMVTADHKKLFIRGGVLAVIILVLSVLFPSPLIAPVRVNDIASETPSLMAQTILMEFDHTSDTATYMDSIDPYTFDTRAIFVDAPYAQYIAMTGGTDVLALYANEPTDVQQQQLDDAKKYFDDDGAVDLANPNPLIVAASSLVMMGKSGLYESSLNSQDPTINPTYALRFLSDTGVLETKAEDLNISTDQWGMMREEKGVLPPGAWWLAPIGIMNHTILANDDNGDRDGAEILGLLALLLVLFPFIPYVNRLPEKLGLAKKIWGKPTP